MTKHNSTSGVGAVHPQQCNCTECQEMATRLMREAAAAAGVAASQAPSTAHIRSVPGGAAFLRVAGATAPRDGICDTPAYCASVRRCTRADTGKVPRCAEIPAGVAPCEPPGCEGCNCAACELRRKHEAVSSGVDLPDGSQR